MARNKEIEIVETIDGKVTGTREPREGKGSMRLIPRSAPDKYIWGLYIAFLVVSVIELFSASSTEVRATNVYFPLIRHVIFLAGGVGIVIWLQNIPYIKMRKAAIYFGGLSLGLLIASSVVGEEINGAQRAIHFAGVTIQPAEIAKLAVVLVLASILSKNQEKHGVKTKGVVLSMAVVLLFAGIMWVNGLTNTILMMVVSLCMFIIGGIQWKKIGVVLLVYGCGAGVLMIVKYSNDSSHNNDAEFDAVEQAEAVPGYATMRGGMEIGSTNQGGGGRAATHKNRVARFLAGVHPGDTINDFNRQEILARFAQANGGLVGKGPGNSRESARLPLAFSDYIYSIIVEDTGFVGGVILLVLFMLLLARAGAIAYKCSRAFPAFLIMGCAVMIVFQALVHMAIVTGLGPVSGQPLPFISKGGTSILVMSAAIGMMLSVSRYAVTSGKAKEIKEELRALPEDLQAANITEYRLEEK